ncbi:MAG TPA: hypothetical protein VGU22_17610 [Methylomirabilota bacterium]|nr:hypothetical protein [Methylomirabilota bacterium]
MKSLVAAVILIALCTPGAFAAPGDPRTLQGTLEWPGSLGSAPFVVVRGDDGGYYYADIAGAQRRGGGVVTAGGRLSVLGVEGTRPFEISAVVVGPGDSALVGGSASLPSDFPSASPSLAARPAAPTPAVTLPEPSAPPFWQVEGKVVGVTPREMVLDTRRGQRVTVNIESLSPWAREMVGHGDEIKLFGDERPDRRLVANGFIYLMPPALVPPPSASPLTGR